MYGALAWGAQPVADSGASRSHAAELYEHQSFMGQDIFKNGYPLPFLSAS